MHDLIGAGVAAARKRLHWTQEETARNFRWHGLTAYRTGTVGQLEAGLRRPRLDEVVLICAALEVSLDELLPDTDEEIELGDGASLPAQAVRAVLAGTFNKLPDDHPSAQGTFPGEVEFIEAFWRARPEEERIKALIEPVRQYARGEAGSRSRTGNLLHGDVRAAMATPTDAERHAARRLGRDPAVIKLASRALWDHRDFAEERDRRIGDVGNVEPRSLQAKRGLVTRAMLAELREYVTAADAAYGVGADGQDEATSRRPIVAAIVTSRYGVLLGRRNDGVPPWTFLAGEEEPGEKPADTLIREVKEEAGCEVRPGKVIGERTHPATGRRMIYMAARPVRSTKVIAGDEAELAEVRWVSLAEADELLPDMYEPVRAYLASTLEPRP